VQLSRTVGRFNGIEADLISGAVPPRMKLAADVSGQVLLVAHVDGTQHLTFAGGQVVDDQ
jgi:hypothetical protein